MPGSGKSTIGRRLAKAMGVTLLDTDTKIVETTGRTIADIFSNDGEKEFRRIEEEVVRAALAEHGVGLQIHEAPGISASAAGTLLAGSVVTVEPGVYLPGRGGVRIEDTLVVGSELAPTPELLTRFPKELAIL